MYNLTCSGFAIEKLSGNFKEKILKCKQKTTDNKITKNNTTKQLLIQDLLPSNKWEQPAAVGQLCEAKYF